MCEFVPDLDIHFDFFKVAEQGMVSSLFLDGWLCVVCS
jgi:hypothetical protein